MVQKKYYFQVQSVSEKKNYIHIGTAEMISVRKKWCKHGNSRNDQCQWKKVCNNMNSNIDVSTVFSCKVQSVMLKER